jgi:hypothetical protein
MAAQKRWRRKKDGGAKKMADTGEGLDAQIEKISRIN